MRWERSASPWPVLVLIGIGECAQPVPASQVTPSARSQEELRKGQVLASDCTVERRPAAHSCKARALMVSCCSSMWRAFYSSIISANFPVVSCAPPYGVDGYQMHVNIERSTAREIAVTA